MRFLYAMNLTDEYDIASLPEWFENYEVPVDMHGFISESMVSILQHLPEIDEKIIRFVKGWEYSRIPKIDKSILRLATNEILYNDSIPVGVSINEAVELSKKYSGENSFRFLNGILGNIAREGESTCNP